MTDKGAITEGTRKEIVYGCLSDQTLCEMHISLASKVFPNKTARLEKKNVKVEMEKRNITFIGHKITGVFHKDTGGEITRIEACPSKNVATF